MNGTARGSFDVNLTPQAQDEGDGAALGRLSIDKQFSGDLEGTSKGEMLTAGTPAGSAVYVAVERVTGMLNGKRGSFALVHRGTMTRDSQALTIEVVPDSGSGELIGLSGSMEIIIEDGKHDYVFHYALE